MTEDCNERNLEHRLDVNFIHLLGVYGWILAVADTCQSRCFFENLFELEKLFKINITQVKVITTKVKAQNFLKLCFLLQRTMMEMMYSRFDLGIDSVKEGLVKKEQEMNDTVKNIVEIIKDGLDHLEKVNVPDEKESNK